MLRRLTRHPLMHFALLGALLYGGSLAAEAWLSPDTAQLVVRIDDATVVRLRAQSNVQGIPFERLLRVHAEEQMLIDQALRRGFDRRDPVVRRRLIENMQLVHPDASETELLRRAQALDMPRRDELVRRRLVERMRTEIGQQIGALELEGEHPLLVRLGEPRMQLEHVFVAGRDADAKARAEGISALLREEAADPMTLGDPHVGGRVLQGVARADLRRRLGGHVAAAVGDVTPGEWTSPVASTQGWHLLRVTTNDAAVESDPHWEHRARHYLAYEQQLRRAEIEAVAHLSSRYRVELPHAVGGLKP